MPPDRNLRIGARWAFQALDGAHGTIRWRWVAYDYAGDELRASERDFETLTECIEDARLHGYVEPEER